MKTIKINTQGQLHRSMARIFNSIYDCNDICEYTRYIFKYFFVAGVFMLFSVIFGFVFINVIMGFAFSIIYGAWMMSEAGLAGLFMFTTLIVLVITCCVCYYFQNNPLKGDNVLYEAYSSWKNKYCAKITYE